MRVPKTFWPVPLPIPWGELEGGKSGRSAAPRDEARWQPQVLRWLESERLELLGQDCWVTGVSRVGARALLYTPAC